MGMVATSCQQDTDLGVKASGELVEVSLNVQAPAIANRVYSDGETATVLQYAVYNAAGQELEQLTVTDGEIHGSTTVNLQLVTGNTYSVIFWAAAEGAPYTVDFAEKTMTVDYSNVACNNESLDAFYKYHTFTVSGAQTETIELRRPFAQLNIGTNDYVAAEKAGWVPTTSTVTVKQLCNVLNLWDGTVSGTPADVTFAEAAFDKTQTFPVAGYEYLAMNYVLVGAESETVEVVFTYANGADSKTRTVGSVPVQRNHRTNLYGALLTSLVDFNVEIKPEYNEPSHDVEAPALVAVNNTQALKEALVAGASNIVVAAGEYTFPASSVTAGATINCEEGTVFTGISSLNVPGATVVGATFQNNNGTAVSGTINGTFKNCTFDASEALRWCYNYAGQSVVFENCVIKTDLRGFHFDELHGNVTFKNCEINGFNAYGGDGSVTFEGCTFGCDASNYNGLNIYADTVLKDCTFVYTSGKTNFVDMEAAGKSLTIINCTATLDGAAADLLDYVGGSQLPNCTLTVDGVVL